MKITKEEVKIMAQLDIAEAWHRVEDGDLGGATANLDAARAYVDMLQRVEAGAANMRVESIEFGDGRTPFEIIVAKGEGE